MEIKAIAFDLGNTLVEYYEREAFPSILSISIRKAHAILSNFATVSLEEAQRIALAENSEQSSGRVRPLQERFDRVFGLTGHTSVEVRQQAARAFLEPIFERARKYKDSGPTLRVLRQQGYRLALVSNTPWGSPGELWREELKRHELEDAVDLSIFCIEVGWRKPAPIIFERLLQELKVGASECLFIGDEPVWDIEGALAAGIRAVLIDRTNRHLSYKGTRVQNLQEIGSLIGRTS
jgi:HAD superfamily hydrolase (TIGR01509 family)